MRQLLLKFVSAVAILLVSVAALAQGPGFGDKPERFETVLKLDWAAFKADQAGKTRLELYYQVFNFGLQFSVDGREYVANYDASAEIFDSDNDQVESFERSRQIRVASVTQTKNRYDYRTSQFGIDLDPGKYTVRFVLTDKGSNQTIHREIKVALPGFSSSEPELSSLEFAQAVGKAEDSSSIFVKGDSLYIPSVGREYGQEGDSVLWLYMEAYPGSGALDNVLAETVIRQRSRGIVYRDTTRLPLNAPRARHLLNIGVSTFPPGEYQLETTLYGRRMKEVDRRTEMFSIAWTQEALLSLDWKSATVQLSYLATPGELSKIKKAKTLEERRTAFNDFWSEHDPTVGTEENETKREFYRRINVADRQFSSMRREGWKTDRGRIFIVYGEPDQIDDEPYSPEAVPYQIWHYYREGKYRRFVFVDKNDDGDYRLQFPYDGLNQRPDF